VLIHFFINQLPFKVWLILEVLITTTHHK